MKDRRVIVLLVCCLVCTGLLMVTPSEARTLILGHGAAPGNPRILFHIGQMEYWNVDFKRNLLIFCLACQEVFYQ